MRRNVRHCVPAPGQASRTRSGWHPCGDSGYSPGHCPLHEFVCRPARSCENARRLPGLASDCLMNCDEVFEILTRGPFPTGDPSDVDVELHLGECSSCQELAEALRPALELFEEAIPAAESRNLPGYWGAQPSAYTVAAKVARSAYTSRRLRKRSTEIGAWVGRWAAGPAPLLIATVAMGLSLGAVTWIIQFRAADATPDGVSMQSQAAPPTVFEEDTRSANRPPNRRRRIRHLFATLGDRERGRLPAGEDPELAGNPDR